MAVSKEVFANVASCVAAAGSGGTNGTSAPASGTSETWTMSTGYTSFPTASTTSTPQTYFYISDPSDTTHEIVQVTSGGGTGTSWTVTRGAAGTTPVAHASGATWVQTVTHATLQNFKQAPSAVTTAATVPSNSASEIVLAVYQPTPDELVSGATWEAVAFGTLGTGTATTHAMQFALYWGGSGSVNGTYTTGTPLCKILTSSNAVAMGAFTTFATGSSFDVNGSVTWLSSTTATANMNLFWNNATNLTTAQATATATNATAGAASSATPVTISGSGPIYLTAKIGGASGIAQTGTTLTATAPLIYRAA